MKRLSIFLLALVGLAQITLAQQRRLVPPGLQLAKTKPVPVAPRVRLTGLEPVAAPPTAVPAAENALGEQIMGYTYYDLQTNASLSSRLYVWPDGRVSGVWHQSLTANPPFIDRGTGYNKTDEPALGFDTPPTARVESVRTGFPAYDVTANGEEWIFTHVNDPNPTSVNDYKIHFAHKDDQATSWTEGNLPGDTATENAGHLWPRVATGGSDGQTVHVIALTTPISNGGTLVDSLDGQLRYWRSTDGGTSWDVVDVPLPGITRATWFGVPGDAYALAAHGQTVAVLVMSMYNDALLIKSTDNGTTWQPPRVVNDFPLELFTPDSSYTFDDVAAWYDPAFYPDSLAILTTDESGNLLVAPDGTVHVAVPTVFFSPNDTSSNLYNVYLTNNLGIIYWNDGMADNDGIIVGYSPDLDNNGEWGTLGAQFYLDGYRGAFSTLPSLSLDDDDRLYITYITHNELVDTDTLYHRQPFFVRSLAQSYNTTDDWCSPEPVLQVPITSDPIIASLSEYFYPAMARRVDNRVNIQFQHDYEYGISLLAGGPFMWENTIEYVGIPRYIIGPITGTYDAAGSMLHLDVLPNPATTGQATVLFDLPTSAETRVELYTVAGVRVRTLDPGILAAGAHQLAIDVQGLPDGLYFVRVQAGEGQGVRKLVIRQH